MLLPRMLLSVAVLLALASCSPSTPPAPGAPGVDPATLERGRQVYEAEACGACHGERGEGTEVAPTLAGLAAHWQGAELASFLVEPGPLLESDPRLQEMASRWELEMPGVASSSPEDAAALAEYLLHGLK